MKNLSRMRNVGLVAAAMIILGLVHVAANAAITISTLENLEKICTDSSFPLDGDYLLGRDIDATDTYGWNGGAGFIPIGSSTTHFTGAFDGQGHSIAGHAINRPEEDQVGLFGEIKSEGAAIKNLRLENCSIFGKTDVGALAGLNFLYPVISGCSVTGTVTGTGTSVGGLVGRNYDGWIRNCAASVTVKNGQYSSGTGGLIGRNQSYPINDCYAVGQIIIDGWA